MVRLRCKSCR